MTPILRKSLFWIGVILLILPAFVQAYFLMPFPGSQDFEAMKLTYFLQKIILPCRIIGLLLISYPIWFYFTKGSGKQKITAIIAILVSGGLYYFTDISYKAEVMFEEPKTVKFLAPKDSQLPDSLIVMSVVNKGVAKAYPVNFLGYHHKVQDEVGGLPVLVTYCTMCRTGLVFSPTVNGKKQIFRLVGARHYNAILEDADTKSWWYQATGEAAAGPLAGSQLTTIPSEQMTLKAWSTQYPNGLILQPDNHFKGEYNELKYYDRRQRKDEDSLTNPNKFWIKSWVVGISINKNDKAYEWKKLIHVGILNDSFAQTNILLAVENDKHSFHVFDRNLDGKTLVFELAPAGKGFYETTTKTLWNWQGECLEGEMKGKKLTGIQARQEYWRAWKQFHPTTTLWNGK